MHKLEIKLKQHTPLIRFQHDQEGFTLRASEVKPKLDKFVLTKLKGSEKYDQGVKEGWIKNKNGKEWLDYKMIVTATDNPSHSVERIVSVNRHAFLYKEVTIKIYFHSETLGSVLTKNLNAFFVVTNFGLRQSKGYGSFTMETIDLDGVILSNCVSKDYTSILEAYFDIVYLKQNISNIRQTIDSDYKWLKSGDNPPYYKGYKKSLLFCYAVNEMEKNPRWEKRFFKQILRPLVSQEGYFLKSKKNSNGEWNQPIKDAEGHQGWRDTPQKYNYAYIRALLGLAEHFEFQLTMGAKAVVKIVGGEELQRFKSPIQFKVIGKDIYLVGKEPVEILGKTVKLSYFLKERDNSSERGDFVESELTPTDQTAISLSVPKDFKLSVFMSNCAQYIDYIKCK